MSAKTNSFWSRYDVRFAAAAVGAGVIGLALAGAVVWAALMIWNRDFRFRFNTWYKAWVLAGLVTAWLGQYPISGRLNVPPSWIGTSIMLVAAATALSGSQAPRRNHGMPSHWR